MTIPLEIGSMSEFMYLNSLEETIRSTDPIYFTFIFPSIRRAIRLDLKLNFPTGTIPQQIDILSIPRELDGLVNLKTFVISFN
jgi:hypothetical protein